MVSIMSSVVASFSLSRILVAYLAELSRGDRTSVGVTVAAERTCETRTIHTTCETTTNKDTQTRVQRAFSFITSPNSLGTNVLSHHIIASFPQVLVHDLFYLERVEFQVTDPRQGSVNVALFHGCCSSSSCCCCWGLIRILCLLLCCFCLMLLFCCCERLSAL